MSIRECVRNNQAFAALQYAYDHRDAAAREHRRRGGKVVGTLGYDVPQELLIAADLFPAQIGPVAGIQTPLAERYLELSFQTSTKLCFETLVNGCCSAYIDYLAVSNSSDQFVRLYLYLRELRREKPELPIPELEFIDWLFGRTLLYAMRNERSLKLFWETAERWAGRSIREADYQRGVQICNENRAAVRELLRFRCGEHVHLTGEEALVILGAGLFMDKPEHTCLVRALCADIPAWPEVPGTRIFFSGTDQADVWLYRTLEDSGAVVVGEDHNWGAHLYERDVNPLYTPLRGLVDRYMLREGRAEPAHSRFERRGARLRRAGRSAALPKIRGRHQLGLSRAEKASGRGRDPQPEASESALSLCRQRRSQRAAPRLHRNDLRRECDMENESKSTAKKALQATRTAAVHQKEWFAALRRRVEQGDGFALVPADFPMEILRAMNIPFAVNQWWVSICAAKRMTPRYNRLLQEAGYPTDICSYCATSFGESLDPEDRELGPWGGLPKSTLAITRLNCDYISKIWELFARQHNIGLYTMETTVARKLPLNWWKLDLDRWEELYDPERLDTGVEELRQLISFLERKTGKMFDLHRLQEVKELINEQEGWYRKTRDLIAQTVPAPVTVADTVNAVMQGQWQRGTRRGAEHAKSLYEEVKAMADAGKAAVPNEKYRLMWIGRGLWHDFAFYQDFEEKYGAVFIWAMYLGLAADGYIRNHVEPDPLRALAARFVGLEDFLHMPPWNSQWFLKEALHNKIDGVVYMVPDSCAISLEGSYFTKKALEDAGIPVLMFKADPVNPGSWSRETMSAMVEDFIVHRAMKKDQ